MIDAPDVQHHLERGLLLFSRGMVFEARDAWRRVLQIEPSNAIALDYIESTEAELNDYDRHRETDLARMQDEVPRRLPSLWEEVDVVPEAADSKASSPTSSSKPETSPTTTGWAPVPEDEPGLEEALDADDWQSLAPESPSSQGAPTEPRQPANKSSSALAVESNETGFAFTEMADSTDWEPLDWINEDTPAGASPTPRPTRKPSRAGQSKANASSRQKAPPSELFTEEAPPVVPTLSAEDEIEASLAKARKAGKSGNWWEARELLKQQLQSTPGHRALALELEVVERELVNYLERKLGPPEGIPRPAGSMADLYALNLDSVSGYLLSLIDGVLTLEDIYTLASHIDQTTVMYRISELLERGAVTLQDPSHRSSSKASPRRR